MIFLQVTTAPARFIKPGMDTYLQAFYIDMDLDIVGAK
jgi:hypothetical protein